MPYKKFAKKFVKKVKEVTGNRYGRGAKQLLIKGVPQLTKDVLMLKKMVNAEKRRLATAAQNATIGQCNFNSNAYVASDITPIPSQALTVGGRSGSSIKLNSAYLKFQFYHQSNTQAPMRIKIMIAKVTGTPETNMSTFFQSCFSQNAFLSGIYDFNSQPNPDYFKAYKIIKTKYVNLQPDTISNVQIIKDISIPLRFKNHHIRFNSDSNTVTNGQLVMWIVADSGNVSSGSASTLSPIPVTGTSTGAIMNYSFLWYYYDN